MNKFIDFLNNLIDLKHYLIYDNNKIIAWTFVFIRNEERFFATIKKWNEWFLVDARGKEISDPSIYIPDMKVSEKWDQVAYVSFPKEGERNLLYINDTVIEKAFKIDILGWNEDGILGYLIQDEKGKKKYLEYK